MPKTPNAAVEQDASLWKSFWQTDDGGLEAKLVLDTLRARVFAQLAQESRPNESDMPEYTSQIMHRSVRIRTKRYLKALTIG